MALAQNLVEQINDWEFIELWVYPIVFPPRILMLVGGKNSKCCIYEPSANYKPLFLSSSSELTFSSLGRFEAGWVSIV